MGFFQWATGTDDASMEGVSWWWKAFGVVVFGLICVFARVRR